VEGKSIIYKLVILTFHVGWESERRRKKAEVVPCSGKSVGKTA
jgi:hypothetical protein